MVLAKKIRKGYGCKTLNNTRLLLIIKKLRGTIDKMQKLKSTIDKVQKLKGTIDNFFFLN